MGCPRVTRFCHRRYDLSSQGRIIGVLSLRTPTMIKARELVRNHKGSRRCTAQETALPGRELGEHMFSE